MNSTPKTRSSIILLQICIMGSEHMLSLSSMEQSFTNAFFLKLSYEGVKHRDPHMHWTHSHH